MFYLALITAQLEMAYTAYKYWETGAITLSGYNRLPKRPGQEDT